jgi:hypothetical protein
MNRRNTRSGHAVENVAHFFVDEAGDLTIFDKKGRIIVGEEGVSNTFMLGIAETPDPQVLADRLNVLREGLLKDPYFTGVPSMRSHAGKTALAFHAKDDVPEVRREVFKLLAEVDLKVFACIRRKKRLAMDLRESYLRDGVKQRPESLYDDLVTRLFKERLHQAERNHIIFARRGKADRNIALNDAIQRAKRDFDARWRKGIDRPTTVASSVPSETTCLQAVDYCLWALQRMVERREERYFALLQDKFRLVLDRDDDRRHGYGEYYTSRNPLTLERLMPVT